MLSHAIGYCVLAAETVGIAALIYAAATWNR